MPLQLTPKIPPYYQESQGSEGTKQYIALATQTGTNPPTMTIIKNTIGNIIWTYDDVGYYVGTLANAFPIGKVITTLSNNGEPDNCSIAANYDENIIELYSHSTATAPQLPANNLLTNAQITITVYP